MLEGRRNDQKIMVKVVQKNPYAKKKKAVAEFYIKLDCTAHYW
jgi:hypothetical protein